MRKTLFATASALALVLGATAGWAQQSPTAPGSTTIQPGAPGSSASPGTQSQLPSATQAPATMNQQSFRAFSEVPESQRNVITMGAADFSVDELQDAEVYDSQGEQIGQIEDLLVGIDNRVEKVLVDVSDLTDKDEHFVAVDVSELQRGEGDASDQLVIDKSKDQIKSQYQDSAAYQKQNDRWMPSSASR